VCSKSINDHTWLSTFQLRSNRIDGDSDYFWKVRQAVSVLELSRFRDNSRERVLEGHLTAELS
jgi:hypothetical protein